MNNDNRSNGYDWINRAARTERYRVSPLGENYYRRENVRGVQHDDSVSKTRTSSPYKNAGPSLSDVFELNVLAVADEVAKVVARKQNDYGPNNILRSPYGPLAGLAVRLYDKVARLANLAGGKKPSNESLRDTFIDIAGYGLIGLMILDETFPKEQ